MTRYRQRLRALVALLGLAWGATGPGAGLRVQSQDQVSESIGRWSSAYQVSGAWMSQILYCESRFDPQAYNPSGASGIAQWQWPSFIEERANLNADTRLAPGLATFDPEYGDVWSIDAAIHVMAHTLYEGRSWRWVCA